MRVCVFSKEDGRGGGASVVAERLAMAYRHHGHEVTHMHLRTANHPYGRARWMVERLKTWEGKKGLRDHSPYELLSEEIREIPKKFDAVHVHDTSTALSHAALEWISERIRTLWTLHDCSPFTAGCLYPGDCSRFEQVCGDCPKISDWPLNARVDRTSELHERRKKCLSSAIRFTAPSRWMISQFLRAGGQAQSISMIPNGVDLDVFRPRDRDSVRAELGLAGVRGPLLLYSAGWLHDSRKGPNEVRAFVSSLGHLAPTLVLVGRYSDEAASIFAGLNCVHAGFVRSDEERASIYSACDATLTFSREENAPLIAIESLAVGTPVFGFATGGLPEIITNGQTGYLAPTGRTSEVASAFTRIWSEGKGIRDLCTSVAQSKHDWINISQEYLKLMSA